MNYKVVLYVIFVFISIFGISGLDLDKFFKKGKPLETYTLIMLVVMGIAYLATNFVLNFVEASSIIHA